MPDCPADRCCHRHIFVALFHRRTANPLSADRFHGGGAIPPGCSRSSVARLPPGIGVYGCSGQESSRPRVLARATLELATALAALSHGWIRVVGGASGSCPSAAHAERTSHGPLFPHRAGGLGIVALWVGGGASDGGVIFSRLFLSGVGTPPGNRDR